MIPEVTIRYDNELRPVAAECCSCGQAMPKPPSDLHDSAAIIVWFSDHFLEHRKQAHPIPRYGFHQEAETI